MRQVNWKHSEDQEVALDRYGDCVTKTIVAEQLFRAQIGRQRPGWFRLAQEEDE